MNVIHLCGTIDEELFEMFSKEMKELDDSKPLTVYLNTEGGDISYADSIADMLDAYPSLVITVATGNLMSAGLFLFLRTDSIKRVSLGTLGLWHLASTQADSRLNHFDNNFRKSNDTNEEGINRLIVNLMRSVECTEESIKKVLSHEDWYIDYKEIEREAIMAQKIYHGI